MQGHCRELHRPAAAATVHRTVLGTPCIVTITVCDSKGDSSHILLCPALWGTFWNSAIRPSVSHGAAAISYRHAGCLQLSGIATAGHQRYADCGRVRRRTQIRRDFWIELPSAEGEYRLAVPGAILCSTRIKYVDLSVNLPNKEICKICSVFSGVVYDGT